MFAYRQSASDWRKLALYKAFFEKNKTVQRINEEICSITKKGKIAKDEWENEGSDFLLALYNIMYKIFFQTLVANLFKQRYINSVTSHKYLNKLISDK